MVRCAPTAESAIPVEREVNVSGLKVSEKSISDTAVFNETGGAPETEVVGPTLGASCRGAGGGC